MNEKSLAWLQERIAAAVRPDPMPDAISPMEAATYAPALVPCVSRGDWGGAVLVRYVRDEDEQAAFNVVAASLPEGMKLAPEKLGGPQWTFLPPTKDGGCPCAMCRQNGYIGAKWGDKTA